MTSVDVTQNLRPLKLAYIVRPKDMASLKKVIETNSFLWGANYNPVLPLYKRTPQYLNDNIRLNKISELLYGNLKFFEPDFIVITGDIQAEEIQSPPCEVIKLEDIYENIGEEGMPGYGIGLWEIVGEYYNKEFKFLRRDKRAHYFPSYDQGHNCLFKSVFGCFPQELAAHRIENITEILEGNEERITSDNYLSFLEKEGPINIHRLNSYDLRIDYSKYVVRERNVVLILDPTSFIDVVDYINLKAAGYKVLPILRSSLKSDHAKKLCLEFIEDEAWVHRDNPHATNSVTMQRSRTVTEEEIKAFHKFVDPSKFEGKDWPKCFMSLKLPDFWSKWVQEKGRVHCVSITSRKKEVAAIADERRIKSRAIAPSFISKRNPRPYKSRFANDIAVNTYASNQKTFEADIYPSNSDEVVRAAGLFGLEEWLIKGSGITKLCKAEDELIFFNIQNAQEIFLSWLKSEGWEAKISDAGKVAYQMLKHLGGPWGIIFLQGRKLIKFLVQNNDSEQDALVKNSYAKLKRITEHKNLDLDQWQELLKPFTESKPESSGIASPDFRKKAKEAYNDHYVRWGEDKFIKRFFEHNIFQLGTRLQCDVCARRSWHPIDSLDYTIKCPQCLNTFEVPSHNPDSIKWSYKTIGPFSAAGKAAGAYCVLLTAKFFDRDSGINNATTTILSFEAVKGDLKFEADVGLFYREGSYFDRSTELIFCECKTYKRFTKKDIDKMKVISKQFPGSIIVFATLNDDLTAAEKSLIKPFVNTFNKYYERDRPKNPVMVLTVNELCAHTSPPYCWEDKGGKYKPFAKSYNIHGLLDICQATQMIYLGIESWHQVWEKKWMRRTENRASKK